MGAITRQSDQINIRVPDGMREKIQERAAANRRSMNAEIVHYIDLVLSLPNDGRATGIDHRQIAPSMADQ